MIRKYIKQQEKRGYPEGIPDEAPSELESNQLVPSYRRICRALLKNDLTLQSLGFSKPDCAIYSSLKRIELGIVIEKR
jgi:predicted phosphoadenosine phosphosulfate sulfurtransferase